MSTLQERMDEAFEIGDRIKQASLINREFIMLGVREETYNSTISGKEEHCYVADIMLDGEQHEAWMGGRVMGQISVLRQEGAFPIKLKEIKDGQAYKLLIVDENPVVENNQTNGTYISPGPAGSAVTIGTQSPQERAQELFMAALVAKGDDAILELVAASGASDAVMFSAEGKLTLDASKLTLPVAVKLIAALQ